MPSKKLLGLDIGNYRIKMAVGSGNVLNRYLEVRVPENMVKDDKIVSWDAMGDYLKETLKRAGIRCKDTAIVLPTDTYYLRRVTMPLMTVAQLKINLPYEFHDYITEDMDNYVYDYAVFGTTEKEMNLVAVAASKEFISHYADMCKRAKLRLSVIAPDVIAFNNLIRDYEKRHDIEPRSKDYAIADIGDRTVKIHFFTKGIYEITRSLEPGCHAIASAIGEVTGQDERIVRYGAENNTSATEQAQQSEEVTDVYSDIAMKIMRVLNFYSFNNPNNTIDTLYYCGGGSEIKGLMDEIQENVAIPLKSMSEMVQVQPDFDHDVQMSPQALGITMSV